MLICVSPILINLCELTLYSVRDYFLESGRGSGRARQGSYSADSPGRPRPHTGTSHPYADFITDNDIKKGTGGYEY